MKNIPFAFFGTPYVASQTLDILAEHGFMPSVIVTSPDSRKGRGMQMAETPVSEWAKIHNIPCLKPEKINDEFISLFNTYRVELSVVVAYGKILPEKLIDLPAHGTINIHYSLLPSYRGASPVEEALRNGDIETGVSIQKMAFKLDSGSILAEETVAIGPDEMKEELRAKLIRIGGAMLVELLPKIIEGNATPKIQDESKATYCAKIKKEDGQIDPRGNAQENYNKYRAFEGWPGIFFFQDGKRIKIRKARYKNDSFIIERVIPEGKKEISYDEFLKSNTSK